MNEPHQEIDKSKAEQENSRTVTAILEGRATFKFLSENTQSKNIHGKDWPGSAYIYKMAIPNFLPNGETWITTLSTWSPLPLNYEPYVAVPKSSLWIMTGQGEMLFTANEETQNKVLDEISRQMDLKQD